MTRVTAALQTAIWIDVEASGLGAGSYPIEIGWATFDGLAQGLLIRPAPGWIHWDPQAEALHGIERDLLFTCGLSVETIVANLGETLAGHLILSDAPEHDGPWLARLFDAAGAEMQFTLEDATTFACAVGERFGATDTDWERAERFVRRHAPITHRAADDARHWAVLTRLLAGQPLKP